MRKAESGFGFLLASSTGAARGLIKLGTTCRSPKACAEPGLGGSEGMRVEEATWEVAVHRLTVGLRAGGRGRMCSGFNQGCLLWPGIDTCVWSPGQGP